MTECFLFRRSKCIKTLIHTLEKIFFSPKTCQLIHIAARNLLVTFSVVKKDRKKTQTRIVLDKCPNLYLFVRD